MGLATRTCFPLIPLQGWCLHRADVFIRLCNFSFLSCHARLLRGVPMFGLLGMHARLESAESESATTADLFTFLAQDQSELYDKVHLYSKHAQMGAFYVPLS